MRTDIVRIDRRDRRILATLQRGALCAAVALTAVACGGSDKQSAATGGTLIVAMGADADVLIPPLTQSSSGKVITDMLFEPIAMIGDSLNTIGTDGFRKRLADDWQWSDDSLSIAFHLDPKARWHDGRPVVAGDVKFTVDLFKNPESGAHGADNLGNVDSVTVRDSSTFVVWYHERSPEQFFEFVYNVIPIPAHVYGAVPADSLASSPLARAPVGSGRFRFVRWEAGSLVELIADTASWRGRPSLDRLIFSITTNQTAMTEKVLTGEADFVEVLRGEAVKKAATSPIVLPVSRPSLSYVAMVFRVLDSDDKRPHPLFGDRRVRRAIAMSIDRPTMVQNILDTLGAPGIGPIVRSLGVVGSKDAQVGYDVDGAKQLLDSAGWRVTGSDSVRTKGGKRLAFAVLTQANNQAQQHAATIIQDQLRKVGVQLTVNPVEFQVLAQHFRSKKFDALILGFQADASPSGIRQNWSSESARSEGGFNRSGYLSPAFDATIDSAASTFDKAKSAALYRRAVSILLADAPAVWLYEPRGTGAVHRRVVPAGYRADYWWAHLDEWSIDPSKMIDRDRIGLRVANR